MGSLGEGERRLLYDLRHRPSKEVALEHKARADAKQAASHKSIKERLQWEAKESLLNGPLDLKRSEMASDWPHATTMEQYCDICRCFGCRAPNPKEL